MKHTIAVLFAAAFASGCAMKEFSSTPFYTGTTVKYTGAVEDRVNLWPLAYWRAPIGSVAWPLVSFGSDHFALRPLYSQYRKSGSGGYDEFNVLWPVAQFDTDEKDYRVFPFFWGSDYSDDPYFCLFPLAWYNDEFAGIFPFFWATGGGGGGFCVFPFFWAETLDYRDGLWHTLFPLYYYKSYEANEDNPASSKFWAFCGLAGYDRRDGEFRHHRILPLYFWDNGDFYSIPYSRYASGSGFKNRFMLGLAGYDTNKGGYSSSWIFPFYSHDVKNDELITPLYGSVKDTNWVVPFYYKDKDSFISLPLCCEYGGDGKIDSAFSLPLLSGYYRDGARNEKLFYALLGLTGYVENKSGEGSSWLFPLYYNDDKSFYTLLYGHNERCRWLAPVFYSDDKRLLTPLYGYSSVDDSSWLIPFYYKDRDSLVTPLYGRDGDSEWLLPLYCREDGKSFYSIPYSWTGGGTAETNRYYAAALAGTRSGSTEGGWLFPLFDLKRGKSFTSIPYSWVGGGTAQTNRYYAAGFTGTRSGERDGWWVFPFYDKVKSCNYDKYREYVDMDKLPGDIVFSDAVYTNWTWNAKAKKREIKSFEPYVKATGFYEYDNADLCLVSDNDRTVNGYLPYKSREYHVTYNRDQGNRLAYRYEGTRKVRFDITSRKKTYDVEEGASSLFFFLYNASHRTDRIKGTSYTSRKVLFKLWDREEENGDVSLDVFPGFTYDSKKDGYVKTSFLWRLFRYESDPAAGTSVDLLFIPLWR